MSDIAKCGDIHCPSKEYCYRFTAPVGVFVVDKVIAFKLPLLSDNQNDQLFDLIKTLTLMIFSYYFGTKKEKDATE